MYASFWHQTQCLGSGKCVEGQGKLQTITYSQSPFFHSSHWQFWKATGSVLSSSFQMPISHKESPRRANSLADKPEINQIEAHNEL